MKRTQPVSVGTTSSGWLALATVCALMIACGGTSAPTPGREHSSSGLYAAAISDDGRFAVVSSFNDGTSYWDLTSNRRLYDWRHEQGVPGEIERVAFSPDGSHVITADARSFVVWDTASGRPAGIRSVDADITGVALSNAARHVLIGLKDGRALHIDRRTERRLDVVAHAGHAVSSVELSADGTTAITGGNDGRVMVWDANSGQERHAFQHAARILLTELDADGRKLLVADKHDGVIVRDLESGRTLARLALDRRQQAISAARFSPDGTKVLVGLPGGHVWLFDAGTGTRLDGWRAPDRPSGWAQQRATVRAVGFNAADRSVVAESSNGLGQSWPLAAAP